MADQWDIDRLIETTFIANWSNGIDYYFANSPPPNDTPDTYINVLSFPGTRNNVTIGKLKTRCIGTLIAEVRHPKHTGTGPIMRHAEEFADIFENKTIGGVHFREANITPSPTATHYGTNVLIAYIWDRFND